MGSNKISVRVLQDDSNQFGQCPNFEAYQMAFVAYIQGFPYPVQEFAERISRTSAFGRYFYLNCIFSKRLRQVRRVQTMFHQICRFRLRVKICI